MMPFSLNADVIFDNTVDEVDSLGEALEKLLEKFTSYQWGNAVNHAFPFWNNAYLPYGMLFSAIIGLASAFFILRIVKRILQ